MNIIVEKQMDLQEIEELKQYRALHGPYLNPRRDFVFKALFTDNSEQGRLALTGIIEATTGRSVREAAVVNNEPAALFKEDKHCAFDVSAVFNDGERAEIEMQGQNDQGSFADRITYLAARLMAYNVRSGQDYADMRSVYQIAITDFTLTSGQELLTHYRLYSPERKAELGNSRLNVITLELPKIKPFLKSGVETLSKAQLWGIFLKKADDPEYEGLVREICLKEKSIMAAQEKLKVLSMEEPEWLRQLHEDKAIMDYVSRRNHAIRTGLKQGLEQGMQQGLEQGLKQGISQGIAQARAETALNLKDMGLSVEQIAKATGLSEQEILSL